MINKELDRLEILQKILEKRLKQKEAAFQLNLAIRQIERLCKRLKKQGPKGLVSRNRGKPSIRKMCKHLKESVLELICFKYSDFGPTLAHEKLTEVHNFKISVSSVRNIMVEFGGWTPKKAKKKRVIIFFRESRFFSSSW